MSGPEEAQAGFSGPVHGTSVVIGNEAIFLRGPSGSGKSDLALRLIDRGARLLSDDYTYVHGNGTDVFGKAAEHIAGLLEVRGMGIMRMAHVETARIALIVRLSATGDGLSERLPPSPLSTERLCGVDLPVLALHGFAASAPLKIELALRHISGQCDFLEP